MIDVSTNTLAVKTIEPIEEGILTWTAHFMALR